MVNKNEMKCREGGHSKKRERNTKGRYGEKKKTRDENQKIRASATWLNTFPY